MKTLYRYAWKLLLIVGISAMQAGCVTTVRRRATCAWCKGVILSRTYYYDAMTRQVSKNIPGGGMLGQDVPEVLGVAPDFAQAKKMISDDLSSEITIKYEGYFFCSLRCLNAYKASKGIKEDRIRVIPHE